MDLSNMSSAQLRELQDQVAKELVKRASEDKARAIEQINAIALRVGATVEELVAAARTKSTGSTGPVAARYRNPADNAQQWTGRGRQPQWVKEWVDAGKALDGLRIAA